MTNEPQIVDTKEQLTAALRLTIPRAEIQAVIGPGIQEVMSAIDAQGVLPAGPWLSHHLRLAPDIFDFEITVPVNTAITPAGRVYPSRLPAETVARTIYQGPYEGLAAAWGEFGRWIAANDHKPAGHLWECYITGPESSPDPGSYRTELNWPLLARP